MFNNMNYAYEVYLQKSFSKAAERFGISQPSLSATVKKIESRVGGKLFDRSVNPVRLTELGREYIRAVEQIMEVEGAFALCAGNLRELRAGRLTLGGDSFAAGYVIPRLLAEYAQRYPGIHLEIREGEHRRLLEQLAEGELDFYLSCRDDLAGCTGEELYTERLLLAVPESFACNGPAKVFRLGMGDILRGRHLEPEAPAAPLFFFREEKYILTAAGSGLREAAEALLAEQDLYPAVVLEPARAETAYRAACGGMGITVVPDTVVRELGPAREMVFYKLSGEGAVRRVRLCRWESRPMTLAMEAFAAIALPGASPKG